MWLVKNRLKATLTLRGLGVSIRSGDEFDLDVLGRDLAEGSNQVQVAFEEGYLENLNKVPRPQPNPDLDRTGSMAMPGGLGLSRGATAEELDEWKRQFMSELKQQLPTVAGAAGASQLEQVRAAISSDVQALVNEFKLLRDRFETTKAAVRHDARLSDVEMKARLAFLDEQEQALLKNFDTVGREQRVEDGDVMDKADLLSNL